MFHYDGASSLTAFSTSTQIGFSVLLTCLVIFSFAAVWKLSQRDVTDFIKLLSLPSEAPDTEANWKSFLTTLLTNHPFSKKLKQFSADELETSCDQSDYLGSGGFGAIRKCYHEDIGVVVAKCTAVSGSQKEIAKTFKLITDEANVLSRCEHENIIKVLGYSKWADSIAIIMEYIDGGNLHDLLGKIYNLAWCIRLQIAQQTSSALCYLHYNDPKKVIVHGDLKPENILLTRALQVKLADFGSASRAVLAESRASSITLPSIPAGHTPSYAAPEVRESLSKRQVLEGHPSMDMYSFGGILFEIATQANFDRLELFKVENFDQEFSSDQDRFVFEELKTILMRCLDLDKDLRPNSKLVSEKLREVLKTVNDDDIKLATSIIFRLFSWSNTEQISPMMMMLSDLRPPFDGSIEPQGATSTTS